VATFTPLPLYLKETILGTHCAKVCVDTTDSWTDILGEEINFLVLPEIKPRFFGLPPAFSLLCRQLYYS
jgi:hypothetical protein